MAWLTLTQARKLVGWSQSDLAAAVGVNPTVISGVERMRNQPRHGLVVEIVEALRAAGLSGLQIDDVQFVQPKRGGR